MNLRGVSLLAAAVLVLAGNAAAQPHSKARAECDALRRAVVATVESALRTFGEFAPYGAGLTSSREVVPLSDGSPEATGQQGDATAALRNLRTALR